MIPLTLTLSLQGRGDIIGASPLRGEGTIRQLFSKTIGIHKFLREREL
jgi:hypothetical protein